MFRSRGGAFYVPYKLRELRETRVHRINQLSTIPLSLFLASGLGQPGGKMNNETQESSKREAYYIRRKEAMKLLNPNGYPEKNKTHTTYWSIEAVDFVKF